MNLKHRDVKRNDKRLHMERLLCELGFSNVSFPIMMHADDLDIASLILSEVVSVEAIASITDKHGAGALRPYLATAVDCVRMLAHAAAEGYPLFAVFEDDLVAGACPAETNRRIAAALRPAEVAARCGRAVPGGLRRGMWGPPPRAPADPTARPG